MATYRRAKVLDMAKSQVGYLEKKSNKNLDSKTKNAGSANYTKYNRDMKKVRGSGTLTDYWCANFVSWCFYKAYGKSGGKSLMYGYTNYVPTLYSNFEKKGRVYKNPRVGDIVIFKNKAHTGIVYKVTDSYCYTIEGNTSSTEYSTNGGCVAKKKYARSSSYLYRFCRPKYNLYIKEFPQIQKGDTSIYCKKLKNYLRVCGYGGSKSPNKKFGDKTKTRVKKFQKKYSLTVDGVVGTKTWTKLGTVYNKKKS